VEVYVKSIRQFSTETYRERGCEHTATGQVDLFRPQNKLQFKRIRGLPDEEKEALKIVDEIAKEKGFEVKVHDLSTFMGKIKARIRGISRTPTVLIENNKIEGKISKEKLIKLIKAKN